MYQVRFGPPLSKTVRNLIIVNAIIFLIDFSARMFFQNNFFIYYFAVIPELIAGKFFIWQIFTYQFLHGGLFHILFNMLILWMFGSELEYRWGARIFLKFYLITGTMTGFMIFLFNYLMNYDIPTIGASGVIFALMVAYAIYWGNRIVYIWMIVPIKVKYFVIIMGVVSFISMISPGQSNISHIGHLGGIVSGFLYMKLVIDRHHGQISSGSVMDSLKSWKKRKEWEKKDQERYDNMNSEKAIDEILAKISRLGMKSLSQTEKKILRDASERMNRKNLQ